MRLGCRGHSRPTLERFGLHSVPARRDAAIWRGRFGITLSWPQSLLAAQLGEYVINAQHVVQTAALSELMSQFIFRHK